LTRIFNQVFEYDEPAASDKADFSDNSDKEAWYYNDVRIAQTNGYIAGFEDNTFRPKDNFTRQQTCVVLAQIAGLKSPDEPDFTIEDEVSEWALDYVAAVIANGDMPLEAGNTFRAKENITRGEVCLALSKYVKYVKVAKPVLDENGEVVTNEQGETVTEYVTETTTQSDDDDSSSSSSSGRTSSGGSSSSSSSSGGSSSGSSSSSNTTTTEATTETTTETVTEAVTETTTEAVTEAETETTTEATFGSDEESALKNIILQLDSFAIPNATSPAVSDILTQIVDTMTEFYNDHDYDVESDMYDVADKVDNLNAEDRSQLISLVLSSCSISDLTQVGTFFKPILRNFSGYLDELGIS
jgi:hypothetical protein